MNVIVDSKDNNEKEEKQIIFLNQPLISDDFLIDLIEINEVDYLKQFYELFKYLEISLNNKLLKQAWRKYYQTSQEILLEVFICKYFEFNLQFL